MTFDEAKAIARAALATGELQVPAPGTRPTGADYWTPARREAHAQRAKQIWSTRSRKHHGKKMRAAWRRRNALLEQQRRTAA